MAGEEMGGRGQELPFSGLGRHPETESEVASNASSWDKVSEAKQKGGKESSKCQAYVVPFIVLISAVGLTFFTSAPAIMCKFADPKSVEIISTRIACSCYERKVDSCIEQFNATVLDHSQKLSYIKRFQRAGFPPIDCYVDLMNETWVSGVPRDCEGRWPAFGPCSTSCAGGTRSRVFQIMSPAKHGGAECGEMNQTQTEQCNEQPCPVDCTLSSWQPDTNGCSQLCGNGTVKETRELELPAEHGGDCPKSDSSLRQRWVSCNVEPCPGALVEDFQGTLLTAAKSMGNIREATTVGRSMTMEMLKSHPKYNCEAGISEDMKEAADACSENNKLADSMMEMSLTFEGMQDECGMTVALFQQIIDSLKGDLPALIQYACSGNTDTAESTLSLLDTHINDLLAQVEVCRTHSKNLKVQNRRLIRERSGYSADTERRSAKRLSDLKSLELGDAALKSEVLNLANSLEASKASLNAKKEEVKQAGLEFENFKRHQLDALGTHKERADDAEANAAKARRDARDLDNSLTGKRRSENMGRLQDARRKAEVEEDFAKGKKDDYLAKIDEYNRAAAQHESTTKDGEEAVLNLMRRVAENQGLSNEARNKQVEVLKKIRGMTLELKNLERFQMVSVASDSSRLDESLSETAQTLRNLKVRFKTAVDYLKQLQGEKGRMKTGQIGCQHAKHMVANIVHSARELFK